MSFNWSDTNNWNTGSDRLPRVSDNAEMMDLSGGGWNTMRIVGEPIVHYVHWLRIPKKEGKGVANFSKPCLGFDPKKPDDGVNEDKCPYCSDLESKAAKEMYVNVIDREAQENEPSKKRQPSKAEKKDVEWNGGTYKVKAAKGEGGWTPMRVLKVPSSMGRKISEMAELNKHKGKIYPPTDLKYGFDIVVKYNSKAEPANAYAVQKGEVSNLTKEEQDYLIWAIPTQFTGEKESDATAECKRIRPNLLDRKGEKIFGEEESSSKGKKKKKKSNEYADDFDVENDEDDDDEDEAPFDGGKKKKKKKGKKSSKDEDDFNVEEDDEDDKPKKKGKKSKDDDDEDDKPKSSKGKKKSKDDDDEDDKPKKKGKKSSKADDEDDKPKKKSGKSKKKK